MIRLRFGDFLRKAAASAREAAGTAADAGAVAVVHGLLVSGGHMALTALGRGQGRFVANYFRLYVHAAAMNLLVRLRRFIAEPLPFWKPGRV
jgi:hypothetical protein